VHPPTRCGGATGQNAQCQRVSLICTALQQRHALQAYHAHQWCKWYATCNIPICSKASSVAYAHMFSTYHHHTYLHSFKLCAQITAMPDGTAGQEIFPPRTAVSLPSMHLPASPPSEIPVMSSHPSAHQAHAPSRHKCPVIWCPTK
jgi:hypothetical protein